MVVKGDTGTGDVQTLIIREKFRKSRWELPGGAVERGQYYVDAACREVLEEVGLVVRPIGFVGCWDEIHSRFDKNSLYICFACKLVDEYANVKVDQDEIVDTKWVNIETIATAKKNTLIDGYPISTTVIYFAQSYLKSGPQPLPEKVPRTERGYMENGPMGWLYLVG